MLRQYAPPRFRYAQIRGRHLMIGTIEVVVDEQGDVVKFKMISPANRYHERMLVSAAKMWKFRPAYKDGQPVRYRTRVRLTI